MKRRTALILYVWLLIILMITMTIFGFIYADIMWPIYVIDIAGLYSLFMLFLGIRSQTVRPDTSFPLNVRLTVAQCRMFQAKFQHEFSLSDIQFEYLEACTDEFRLRNNSNPALIALLTDLFGEENMRRSMVTGNYLFKPILKKYPYWYKN